MKARESALRAKRFEADEKNRKVIDLEQMIQEFERMAYDLECQVKAEEERTGVKDAQHFAYSTFARSAMQRRENLLASVSELQEKLGRCSRRTRRRSGRTRRSGCRSQSGRKPPCHQWPASATSGNLISLLFELKGRRRKAPSAFVHLHR